MRTCNCGGEMEKKSGVSKKNNKPWAGYKCGVCGAFEFEKTEYKGQSSGNQSKQYTPKKEESQVNNLEILKLAVEFVQDGNEEKLSRSYFLMKNLLSEIINISSKPGQDEEIPF